MEKFRMSRITMSEPAGCVSTLAIDLKLFPMK